MPRHQRKSQREFSEYFCHGCERTTEHNAEIATRDGVLRSRMICKECGLEKVGGRIVAAPAN